jgi:hypothetical protein
MSTPRAHENNEEGQHGGAEKLLLGGKLKCCETLPVMLVEIGASPNERTDDVLGTVDRRHHEGSTSLNNHSLQDPFLT